MLDLFPETARVEDGELVLGGVRAGALAAEHGTPLVVYCEETLRAQARAYRAAAPDALVCFGTKAFPNVAVLRLFAEEGLGADVSTLGELRFALEAGIPGERLVIHGNNKSDEELRAAVAAGAGLVVLDALEEVSARPRRACGTCSSASHPASRPTRTSRSAPAGTARSSGSRCCSIFWRSAFTPPIFDTPN